MPSRIFVPGAADLESRTQFLAERLVDGLKPLARVAYNYSWSWTRDGAAVFRDINPQRWASSGENPVAFLNDLWSSTQEAAERDPALMERVQTLANRLEEQLSRPHCRRPGVDGPVVFMCAEFGFHQSMPIYSGGLGVLAGDILKEASDQSLEMIGIGLLYRRGYFRQRLDIKGRQQEFWLQHDPKSLPMARVADADGKPLQLEVELFGDPLAFQVWRVDVGRVPLLLLDANLPENDSVQRWTSGRLYEGNRAVRLAQYGLLGMGGARVLEALGIEPAVMHLNEGHPALAALEIAARDVAAGTPLDEAIDSVRERVVFTTHTPVAAGNETYAPGGVSSGLRRPPHATGPGRSSIPRSLPRRPGRGERLAGNDAARAPRQPPPQRREPPARRGRARHVAPALPGHRRDADHARHERRAPPHVRLRADPGPLRGQPRRRLAEASGAPGVLGGRLGDPERRALGRALRGQAPARHLPAGQGRAGQPAARRAARVRAPDGGEPRPGLAHARLRAPPRHLQAAVPPQPRSGARQEALRRRLPDRSS